MDSYVTCHDRQIAGIGCVNLRLKNHLLTKYPAKRG